MSCVVQANFAHTVSASGIVGVVVAILNLTHCEVPPHSNILQLAQGITSWPMSWLPVNLPAKLDVKCQHLAGLSGTSASGDNIHILMHRDSEAERHLGRDYWVDAWQPKRSAALQSKRPFSSKVKQVSTKGLDELILKTIEATTGTASKIIAFIDGETGLVNFGLAATKSPQTTSFSQHGITSNDAIAIARKLSQVIHDGPVLHSSPVLFQALDAKLPNSLLLDHPTLGQLVTFLGSQSLSPDQQFLPEPTSTSAIKRTLPDLCVTLRGPEHSEEMKPTLFLAAAGMGTTAAFADLVSGLQESRYVYGLERGDSLDVEALAVHHKNSIRQLEPTGPVHLGGYSHGGWVAVRVASLLQQDGYPVLSVIVLDAFHPVHIPNLLEPYLLAHGVPELLLQVHDAGSEIRKWMHRSQPTNMPVSLRNFVEYQTDELTRLLSLTEAPTMGFPDEWNELDGFFPNLESGECTRVLFFNATLNVDGTQRTNPIWASKSKIVKVIDVETDHMQLLDDLDSLKVIEAMSNLWLRNTESAFDCSVKLKECNLYVNPELEIHSRRRTILERLALYTQFITSELDVIMAGPDPGSPREPNPTASLGPARWEHVMDYPYPANQMWSYIKNWKAPYITRYSSMNVTTTEGNGLGAKRFIQSDDGQITFWESCEELDEENMVIAYQFHDAVPLTGGSRIVVEATGERSCAVHWTGHPDETEGNMASTSMQAAHIEFLRNVLNGIKRDGI